MDIESELSGITEGLPEEKVERVHSLIQLCVNDAEKAVQVAETRARQAEAAERSAVARLESRLSARSEGSVFSGSYDHLGERVAQILNLAEQEATQLREEAQGRIERDREIAVKETAELRAEADRYAVQVRRRSEVEAEEVLADARRNSEGQRDQARQEVITRLQEADASYEQQVANSAKASAEFEEAIAERRRRADEEFTRLRTANQGELDQQERALEELRLRTADHEAEMQQRADQISADADAKARQIVEEAHETAARVREEHQREIKALTNQRDGINAQLDNVRQLLASLTGSAAGLILPGDADKLAAATEPAGQAEAASN